MLFLSTFEFIQYRFYACMTKNLFLVSLTEIKAPIRMTEVVSIPCCSSTMVLSSMLWSSSTLGLIVFRLFSSTALTISLTYCLSSELICHVENTLRCIPTIWQYSQTIFTMWFDDYFVFVCHTIVGQLLRANGTDKLKYFCTSTI